MVMVTDRPVEKVNWTEAVAVFPDTPEPRKSRRRPYLQVGLMCYPPSRNGNMPVVRARPRYTRKETQLPARMRIITGMVVLQMVMTLSKLVMWGSMLPTHGAF